MSLSNTAKLLRAYMVVSGMYDSRSLSAVLGIKPRTVYRLKAEIDRADGFAASRGIRIRRSVSFADARTVFDRDGNACVLCGSTEDLTVDHIIPVALGGRNTVSNYQTLCRACNSSKGVRLVDEGAI